MFNSILNLGCRLLFNRISFNIYKKISIPRQIAAEQKIEAYYNVKNVNPTYRKPLTSEEKQLINDYWGMKINPSSYIEYEVFKYFNGFDVRFLPMGIYLPLIARRLNNYEYSEILEHKSLFGYLANGIVRFPKCYCRTVKGEFYSSNMEQINKEEAINFCLDQDRLVMKDSLGGSGGKGVEILKFEGKSLEERKSIIKDAISRRKTDFSFKNIYTSIHYYSSSILLLLILFVFSRYISMVNSMYLI